MVVKIQILIAIRFIFVNTNAISIVITFSLRKRLPSSSCKLARNTSGLGKQMESDRTIG